MKEKFIIKKVTDKYIKILRNHNNKRWAYEELEYLIYEVHKGEYENLNDFEKSDVDRVMNMLRQGC